MNCSKCGNVITPGSSFCGVCGNSVNNQVVGNQNTGKLTVTRANSFVGCAIDLDVYINGALYKLGNGGKLEFDLAPGLYKIDYKVWCRRMKTLQINVVAGNYYVLDFGPDYLWGGFKPSNNCKLQ